MITAIAGLGLMGASFARALKRNPQNTVLGYDKNPIVEKKAIAVSAVDLILDESTVKEADILIIALYPRFFLETAERFLPKMKKGASLIDF